MVECSSLPKGPLSGGFYKLDANSGTVLWKKEIPYRPSFTGGNQMLGSPSVAVGRVFASSNWGDYYCFDTITGEMIWHFSNPTATEFIVSSPIYVDGTVLLIDKFDLNCVNITNGWSIWTKYTGDELYVSPSYADGKAYMVTSQRHIFILDTINNGTKIATATTPSSSWSSPTIANNRLYIGCNDWTVYCFAENITNQPSPTATPSDNSELSVDWLSCANSDCCGCCNCRIMLHPQKANQANKAKLDFPVLGWMCYSPRRFSLGAAFY